MKTIPDNNNLLDLVDRARRGTVVLPQFQRNFVWNRDDITGLLVSILEGHFIGSFLLLRTDADSTPFAIRPIEGVALGQSQLRPDWMVLDGQQRLTSLHYVFSAPDIPLKWTKYPYRFFLDLDKVSAGTFEEAVTSERADLVQERLQREWQFLHRTIPFTELEDWDDWSDAYEDWLEARDRDAYETYRGTHRQAWRTAARRIDGFVVPTIEIPKVAQDDDHGIAEVCAIFEKMNSTGVRLSVYDLLTARMYRFRDQRGEPIDIHGLWEESVAQHPHLARFSGGEPDTYGVYLLRTIALLRGLEVRSKSLVNLSATDFVKDWREAAASMERALERLTSTSDDGFGVFDAKWFPYSTMVSPLAALLRVIERDHRDHRAYDLLRRWYWSAVFLGRYAGAVETTILQDYQDLTAAFRDPGATPRVLAEAEERIVRNPTYALRDTVRVDATYRGIMCLVAIRGAKDLASNDAIEFHELDDHHIFPRAYLTGLPAGERPSRSDLNSIVNRTLIAGSTNRRISRNKPSDYLQRVVPEDMAADILATHFVDAATLDAMRRDDFEGFIDARERVLLAEVRRRLSGAGQPTPRRPMPGAPQDES